MANLFVVIVNFRTGALVVDCLQSLVAEIGSIGSGKVIVVDNCSGDDSVARIATAIRDHDWSSWAEVLTMPRNGGFAYGNNAGIRRVREHDARFGAVILLNPDTTVVRGAFAELGEFLRTRPDAGIAGASIEDEAGQVQISYHRDPSSAGEFERGAQLGMIARWRARGQQPVPVDGDRPLRCDWVSGACMAIRREVLDSTGGLDEGYFLYFEEVDFCVRARLNGWTCWSVPRARVTHLEGASSGIKSVRRLPDYWYASRRRFFVKRWGLWGLVRADALFTIGRASLVIRRTLGLGGDAAKEHEPQRLALDLVAGDVRAMVDGSLRNIGRHGQPR
ncbi:MAG: glycosyltransferase family 2 protein [Caldimonas sp.]